MKTGTLTILFVAVTLALAAILGGLVYFVGPGAFSLTPAPAATSQPSHETFLPAQSSAGTSARCPQDARLYNTKTNDISLILAHAEQVCKLSILGTPTLPFDLARFPNLRELSIHNSQLQSLPPNIGDLRFLTVLHVAHNSQLARLPATLTQLQNLRILRIDGTAINRLPDAAVDKLPLLRILSVNEGQLPPDQLQILQQTSPQLNVLTVPK